jgi:hypothetical protein
LMRPKKVNIAATKIAPRNPHEAKNPTFYDLINL